LVNQKEVEFHFAGFVFVAHLDALMYGLLLSVVYKYVEVAAQGLGDGRERQVVGFLLVFDYETQFVNH